MTEHPGSQVSWKTHLSLMILASPSLRFLFGKSALKHLYAQVWTDSQTMAFLLLSRLGSHHDAVFVWYILDLLLKVPEQVFGNQWVKLALLPLESAPGSTMNARVYLVQQVITNTFGLWELAGVAAKIQIGMKK